MKRLSIILLSLILALSLVACTGSTDGKAEPSDKTASTDPNVGDNDVAVPDSWFTNTSAEGQN